MSEILITLPLSMFKGKSVDDVLSDIESAQRQNQESDQLNSELARLKLKLRSSAETLSSINNSALEPMERAKAYRQLVTDIRGVYHE